VSRTSGTPALNVTCTKYSIVILATLYTYLMNYVFCFRILTPVFRFDVVQWGTKVIRVISPRLLRTAP
jgi:hypothetical protein